MENIIFHYILGPNCEEIGLLNSLIPFLSTSVSFFHLFSGAPSSDHEKASTEFKVPGNEFVSKTQLTENTMLKVVIPITSDSPYFNNLLTNVVL